MVNSSKGTGGGVSHALNYVTTNRFYVEIGSAIAASFTECSGLGVQLKKDVYMEGGVNDQQRILVGHAEFTDVTLKRGITDDLAFWKWLAEVGSPSSITRRNVNILVFNQAGETMRTWTLVGAIPIAWKSSSFQADGNTVAIEELTLAYETLKVAQKEAGVEQVRGRDSTGYFGSSGW
jgi:phage tail-like protein